jgi:hypothetical protein
MTPKAGTQLVRGRPKRKLPTPKFLHLLLDVERHRISVARDTAIIANQPPLRPMPGPKMTGKNWETFQMGSGEIILAFYGADGTLIDSVAEATVPHYFVDNLRPGRQARLRGGLVRPRSDQRLFHTTVPGDAAFVGLFRTEVGSPGKLKVPGVVGFRGTIDNVKAEMRIIPFAFYAFSWSADLDLGRGFPGFEGPEFKKLPRGFELPIPSPPDLDEIIEFALALKILRAQMNWQIEPVFEPISSPPFMTNESAHPVEHSLNIVILGDGFRMDEQDIFIEAARRYSRALLQEEPFSVYKNVINIHVIPKALRIGSGITGCPEGRIRNSYYDVHANHVPLPGVTTSDRYFGMTDTSKAYSVATRFAPLEDIDLILMIVNCELLGGSAPPNNMKMAYASLGELKSLPPAVWGMSNSVTEFAQLAIHESAHVLGGLVDEYITCVPWDKVFPDAPNCARRSQMNNNLDNPPWLELIRRETGVPDPQFEIHDIDPAYSCCDFIIYLTKCIHNTGSLTTGALMEYLPMLGVYWGCMYRTKNPGLTMMENIKECFPDYPGMDCSDVGSCCKLELGRDFFRARAWCKMLSHAYPFCPVCSQELAKRIEDKTGYVPLPF